MCLDSAIGDVPRNSVGDLYLVHLFNEARTLTMRL